MLPVGALGNIVFMVNPIKTQTFREKQGTASNVFADHQVAGNKPISEFLGPALKSGMLTIDLNISLGVVPEQELKKLIEMVEKGEPQLLVVGPFSGGYITLRSVDYREVFFNGLGMPTHIECDVQFMEYIPSLPTQAKTKQSQDTQQRSKTGKGGPERLPGKHEQTKARSLKPINKDVQIDPVTRMPK